MNQSASAYFDNQNYLARVGKLWTPTLRRFNRLVKSYVLFHFFFLIVGGIEIALLISFFTLLSQSSVLAFALALFFLTLFSYFVLRLYLQTRKPEHLMSLCEGYFNSCKEIIHYQEGIPEHHLALARAAHKLASTMHEREYSYYSPPFFLNSLAQTFEKFSCFCHWRDVHKMKELLLARAIEEHIKVVKCEPTNLEVHAALANAYVMLSSLYADPRKYEGYDEEKWIPPERHSEEMRTRFRATAERAIEEFKILNDYAPDDPWVHMQLAYSYHDLQMPEEEIREYEIIMKLRPDDRETLFKLGVLYFQQGQNAQGLRVYEMLKRMNYSRSESLIKFYGAYQV